MRAVVYEAVGAPPQLREVPEPECPADGVLVAVGATGVCRSDWHAWRGHDPVALPHVPGHELAGTVRAVGPQVTRVAVGDRVTTPFVNGCGRCPVCAAGDPQVCPQQTQPGFTGPGSFAEVVALHAADLNVVRLPDALGFVAAAALGCRFATAYRALTAHARLRPGQWLAVHGCGGVGLSAVTIGAALGARVVAVDLAGPALQRARECGAEMTVRSGDPAGTALPMDLVVAGELELYGSHGMAAADYPAMLELVTTGPVRLDRLVGAVIGLDAAPAALMAMDRPPTTAGITVVDLLR